MKDKVCSFCLKDDRKKLMEGRAALICDECVLLFYDLCDETVLAPEGVPVAGIGTFSMGAVRCVK